MRRLQRLLVCQHVRPEARQVFRPSVRACHDAVVCALLVVFLRHHLLPAKLEALVHVAHALGVVVAAQDGIVALEPRVLGEVELRLLRVGQGKELFCGMVGVVYGTLWDTMVLDCVACS